MAYLNDEKLASMGFKDLGQNVKISDKASIYDCDKISIGNNSRIDDFCVISGKVEIGRNVHIAPFCLIAGGEKGITFEDFSAAAYQTQVFTQSDDYSGETLTNPTVPAKYKNVFKARVLIGRHSIIGAGSIIMPGVTLSEGTSVGAMSLIRRKTSPWSTYIGNPAKKIKIKSRDLLLLEKQLLQEESKEN